MNAHRRKSAASEGPIASVKQQKGAEERILVLSGSRSSLRTVSNSRSAVSKYCPQVQQARAPQHATQACSSLGGPTLSLAFRSLQDPERMPLGKRLDCGDAKYTGVEVPFACDIVQTLEVRSFPASQRFKRDDCINAPPPALRDDHAPDDCLRRSVLWNAASTLWWHLWCTRATGGRRPAPCRWAPFSRPSPAPTCC